MAHITELSAALQAALNKKIVHNWPSAKVVLDPDGDAVDLSSRLKDVSLHVAKKKNINPDETLGRISISEVGLKFINKDNYFSPEYIDGPFYHTTTRLYADYTHGGTTIDVPKNFNVKAGLKLYVSYGKREDNATISSIDTTDTNFDRITFSAALSSSNDYNAGAMVETTYRVGQFISIYTVFNGSGAPTDETYQYKGIISELPKINNLGASLTIQDTLRGLLSKQLKANTTKSRLSNTASNLESSLSISRADASTGLLDEDSISINTSYCKIGSWTLTFTSATVFEATDPDGIDYDGDVTTAFYAGDSSVYQLSIPVSAWSGTFESGDSITFNTVCTICYANEGSDGNTVPAIIERLLTETYGGGFSTSEYDTASLDLLKTDFNTYRAGITFSDNLSVLKAIEIMLRHISAAIHVQNNGPVYFKSYKPELETGTYNSLSPDDDIISVEMESLTKYRRITGYFDYENGVFNQEYSYPSNEGEPHIEIKLPAYTADEGIYARAVIRRIYRMWERGLKSFRIKEKWNHGFGFDLNDQFQISSNAPDLDTNIVEIYDLKKDVNRISPVEISAFDISYSFGRYAFTNQHNTDDGRVTW